MFLEKNILFTITFTMKENIVRTLANKFNVVYNGFQSTQHQRGNVGYFISLYYD